MSTILTLDHYWRGRDKTHGHLLTPELRANAQRTVDVANELFSLAGDGGVMLTPAQPYGMARSGWRPPDINAATQGAAKGSLHMQCLALDAEDPYGLLAAWCFANRDTVLRDLGLWMEHPTATPTWCHIQTQPMASFKRTGLRYFYP